ncbi:lytic murein transglycosylase [Aquabacterium parvum]|uniref:lytic murein transglycosylase n=1 Tax=Aquabacterium parvum TaxID=70584 RepID=UPI000718BDC1|nr:lytic murein transglycosylase [Gammaproteobacteria bacterium]
MHPFHASSHLRQARSGFARLPLPCVLTWVALSLAGCSSEPRQTPAGQAARPPAAAAAAPDAATTPQLSEAQRFATWLRDFRATARTAGVSEATLKAALDVAEFRPRTIELDRSQPEFSRSTWDYLDSAVSPTRVANGQAKLAQVRAQADAAASRYGVPAPVLVAVWGMESNYGQNYGDVPVIDALATLAFEGRREAWARGELLAALKIIDQGDIDREHMIGSWAGAMGQTQFMPSAFLARAVDADGDGRRDIWRSMPDVLASTANYLHQAGWVAGEAWAPEVKLPEGFDVSRADPGLRQDATQWSAEGVRLVDGSPLPAMAEASILQPAGAHGPAFLVGRNFRAVLRYNNATSYALGVTLLAQRIDGGAPVQAAWPRDQRVLSRSEVKSLQAALNHKGFATGTPDGLLGPATRGALRDWQRSVGLPADGFATAELLTRLQQP